MVALPYMAKSEARLKALELRRTGMSILSIARTLNVSKGSVSIWCRDINLTDDQKECLRQEQIKAGHQGRIKGAEANRQRRLQSVEKSLSQGRSTIGKLSNRDLLLLGTGLYWGEGSKTRNGTTSVINSEPVLVLTALKWFENCLGVAREDFRPYVYISEIHKGREKIILKFWSDYLQIPRKQFHDVIFLKGRPKKVYENHNLYYGVIALRVRRGTELKYRILGLIEACKEALPV